MGVNQLVKKDTIDVTKSQKGINVHPINLNHRKHNNNMHSEESVDV